MAGEPRLYFSIVRYGDGRARIEISDAIIRRSLTLPEELLPQLNRVLSRKLVSLLQAVVTHLTATSHTVDFWSPRPARSERLFDKRFVRSCHQQLPRQRRRYLYRERLDRFRHDLLREASVPEKDIRTCVDLGLHQWRQIVHTDKWRCAFCGGNADSLLPTPHFFESLLDDLLRADPWRTASKGAFERWTHPRDDFPTGFRIALDSLKLEEIGSDDAEAIQYLAGLAPNRCAVVRLPEEVASPDFAEAPAAQLAVSVDVNDQEHLLAKVPADRATRSIELGIQSRLERLSEQLGGGESGTRRARIARLGAEFAHVTVTTDHPLLRAGGRLHGVSNVVRPLAATIAFGIHARKQHFLEIGGLGVPRSYFYDYRSLALVPELAGYLTAASEIIGKGLADHPEARLCWSAADRLEMMARSEDEIAFRTFFQSKRATDSETLYHFEYLLLLARALIEGLAQLAATVHQVEFHGQLNWRLLITKLRQDKSELVSFIRSDRARAIGDLVSRLRNPLAHSQRWPEISSGSTTRPFAKLIVAEPEAPAVASAIRTLDGDPATWGAEAHRAKNGDISLYLDPFSFAVHLNVFLQAYTARFLYHLAQGAGRTMPNEVPAWDYVNPPADQATFRIVQLMSWPRLPDDFFEQREDADGAA